MFPSVSIPPSFPGGTTEFVYVYINEYSKPVITTTHISPKCNAPFLLACYYRLFIYLQVSFLIFPLLLNPVGVHCSVIFNPFCSLVIISPDVKMNNFTFLRPINIVDKVMFLFFKITSFKLHFLLSVIQLFLIA